RVDAAYARAPAVRPQRPGEDLYAGGLAGPVGADEGDDFARRHRERHPLERALPRLLQRRAQPRAERSLGGIVLADLVELERGLHRRASYPQASRTGGAIAPPQAGE